jgi:hypothetical protein
MKVKQSVVLATHLVEEVFPPKQSIARLSQAYKVKRSEAALLAAGICCAPLDAS